MKFSLNFYALALVLVLIGPCSCDDNTTQMESVGDDEEYNGTDESLLRFTIDPGTGNTYDPNRFKGVNRYCSISVRCACGGGFDADNTDVFISVTQLTITDGKVTKTKVILSDAKGKKDSTTDNPNNFNYRRIVPLRGNIKPGQQYLYVNVYDNDDALVSSQEFLGSTDLFDIVPGSNCDIYKLYAKHNEEDTEKTTPTLKKCTGGTGAVNFGCANRMGFIEYSCRDG